MTTRSGKVISLLLAIVLIAPANAGAAAWMALSMASSMEVSAEMSVSASIKNDAAEQMTPQGSHHVMESGSHFHHAHMILDVQQSDLHDHDEEDCNEHCVSCINHCSSIGILPDSFLSSDLSTQSQRFQSGNLSSHSDLLFRPPIHR